MTANPLVIGLTGGIGSGKTTVAELFSQKGIAIIDTDHLAKKITKPGTPALTSIAEHFGETILRKDRSIDRAKLREIIFAHPEERLWLENLLHPPIRFLMKKEIEEATSPYCIAVIPLLFETDPNPLIQRILVVDAPPELQIQRTKQRDNNSRKMIEAILKIQISRDERLAKADDIIYNHGDLNALSIEVDKLHASYLQLCNTKK